MYNKEEITVQLNTWLETFVEQPHPALGNWAPCPYARAARLGNKIEIIFTRWDTLTLTVENYLYALEEKDVLVICFDHKKITSDRLENLVKQHNKSLMPRNYVILEDHPDTIEYVNGVHMNFGHCGLLVVQKLDKLNTASDQLRNKGYYTHWDSTALDQVVSWRKNEIL
jgi:hypothetical protein